MDRETLVKKINILSDSIRKKYADLKHNVSERDRFLESTFKPVIAPLKEISNNLKNQATTMPVEDIGIKLQEPKEEDDDDFETEDDNLEHINMSEGEEVDLPGNMSNTDNDEEISQNLPILTPSSVNHRLSILGNEIGSKGPLTRKFILKMLHTTPSNRKYHIYGARVENDGLMIGDSLLTTDDEDNIIIKGKSYKGTPGLFELVFRNSPQKYNTRDLNTFKSILKLTNAHKKDYSVGSVIYRNKSKKYNEIISKLFPPHSRKHQSTGKGISLKNTYETNVIYYKDINKIVDRMRLLYEAKQSGHTGVDNELIALVDELRGRGYIA